MEANYLEAAMVMFCRNLEREVINLPSKSQTIISKHKRLYKGRVPIQERRNDSQEKLPVFS